MNHRASRKGLGILLLLLFSIAGTATADVTGVDGDELQHLMDQGVAVIDVRREEEWKQTGVLENSHLLTFYDKKGRYDMASWLAGLNKIVEKDEPFVLICAVGGRTGTISRFLDGKLGIANVHDALGGITRWKKEGRKVVAPNL